MIVTQNITVDGVVEAGEWFDPGGGGSDLLEVLNEQASRVNGFLTGRVTFEEMRGYWPRLSDRGCDRTTLFPDDAPRSLRLTDTRSFDSGIILLIYRRS